ncbi:TerB family tellurite resistance protein [candidate division CSSED10-310 bacterium]|uniref:TerB family tellurite resistance protein n=1 Tax=candidate division CSSED10-310 bacterium TaxID=2855610 RepID=A0ABV6Z1D7_UNCC1
MIDDFVHPLKECSGQVRLSYLIVLARLAHIDNQITSEELAFFRDLAANLGLDHSTTGEIASILNEPVEASIRDCLEDVSNMELRVNLIADMMKLARIDGYQCYHEKNMIEKTVDNFLQDYLAD